MACVESRICDLGFGNIVGFLGHLMWRCRLDSVEEACAPVSHLLKWSGVILWRHVEGAGSWEEQRVRVDMFFQKWEEQHNQGPLW